LDGQLSHAAMNAKAIRLVAEQRFQFRQQPHEELVSHHGNLSGLARHFKVPQEIIQKSLDRLSAPSYTFPSPVSESETGARDAAENGNLERMPGANRIKTVGLGGSHVGNVALYH
jgi:hypothetical protein